MAEQPSNPNPEEYELVPRNQLEHLRHEVERIKRNPFGDTQSSKDLLTALDELNRNVAKLNAVFETASDEIVRDYKDHASGEKLSRVLEQNEKLAKGIVAIADLLKELKELRAEQRAAEPAPPQAPRQSAMWQPATPPAAGPANPFLDQEEAPAGPAPPPGGHSSSGGQRRLPPIDFSDIPPPPG